MRMLLSGMEPLAARVSVKRVAAAGGHSGGTVYFAISGGNVAAFALDADDPAGVRRGAGGRRALTMRNVAIAALVVIATDPASVFRPSFQLSFAAVVALVGAYENFRTERDAGRRVALACLGLWLGHRRDEPRGRRWLPLLFSVYHFQQTSPLGVVGNLMSLPLVGFVMMPAAALAVIGMPFGIEGPFLFAMGWSIDRMVDMAAIVAAWSTHLRPVRCSRRWHCSSDLRPSLGSLC